MIDLIPSADQREIVDQIAGFLSDALPVDRLRAAAIGDATPNSDRANWAQLARLGCFGIAAPEEAGGLGMTVAEEALAFQEFGRHLLSPAALATVLAARLADHAGRADLVASLIDGTRRAGIGNPLQAGGWPCPLQLFDASSDDLVLVCESKGSWLFEASALGQAKPHTCLDPSVSMAVCTPGDPKPLAGAAGSDLPLHLTAHVLTAAMLSGMLEAIRDMAVAQAKTREQFGHAIGTFQAIKHTCADIGLAAEIAWAETAYAALALAHGQEDGPFHAHNARMVAGQGALDAARANIQLHGGMGFTAELGAHLFLKRSHLLNELAGGLRAVRAQLLTLPLDAAG